MKKIGPLTVILVSRYPYKTGTMRSRCNHVHLNFDLRVSSQHGISEVHIQYEALGIFTGRALHHIYIGLPKTPLQILAATYSNVR